MQASLNNAASKRRRREQEKAEREQLLNRRFGHDHTEITVDYLGQEQNSLQNSHRNVDEMIHTGTISAPLAIEDIAGFSQETKKINKFLFTIIFPFVSFLFKTCSPLPSYSSLTISMLI